MKGVILAGGTGSRLSPLTDVTNKHLLPVYDEPMIFKVIKTLVNAGIVDIQIVLGGNSVGDIVRLIGSGIGFGKEVKVSYVFQDKSGGIAEALSLTEMFVGNSNVAVILGDNIFEDHFGPWIEQFEKDGENECYLFLKRVDDSRRFGVATMDGERITKIVEKPQEPESNMAVTGIYFYRGNVFEIIREVVENHGYSARGELEITDVNNCYIERGTARGIILGKFWSDAGTFETLLKSSVFISKKSDNHG